MIGRAKTLARQRCRLSDGCSRAGFEPRRRGGVVHDCSRHLTIDSKRSSINADRTERLKSGAEPTVRDNGSLGAPRFSPYPAWSTHHT